MAREIIVDYNVGIVGREHLTSAMGTNTYAKKTSCSKAFNIA